MRLTGRALKPFRNSRELNKAFGGMFTQLRLKHRSAQNLEEVEQKRECVEPCRLPKKSIWSVFRRTKKPAQKSLEKEKPQKKECETVKFVTEEQAKRDLSAISQMGGTVYRTCGTAYVLQKEHYQQPSEPKVSSEEKILQEMLKDPTLKGQKDPMPPFQSVELKLIELNERKLHPLYKKLMSIPKKPSSKALNSKAPGLYYKTRSGPVMPEEFPPHLKINKELFEKKNIFYDGKRALVPQQMLARMVEMKQNERPQLKLQVPEKPDCSEK
ncbi:uncharacterized protein LOC109546792 isoform X1 [Dendroctonus ponderosae]|nr:uncharacterized protein LOC109546792 isoform X1 [Dendroctonus ponderosae]KAH1018374.1 hypothetical protein HUJ05_006161 [Dendroctonus ponderosae]